MSAIPKDQSGGMVQCTGACASVFGSLGRSRLRPADGTSCFCKLVMHQHMHGQAMRLTPKAPGVARLHNSRAQPTLHHSTTPLTAREATFCTVVLVVHGERCTCLHVEVRHAPRHSEGLPCRNISSVTTEDVRPFLAAFNRAGRTARGNAMRRSAVPFRINGGMNVILPRRRLARHHWTTCQ